MDFNPQGTDTCLYDSGRLQWDHHAVGFRERCCCYGSAPGGRLFCEPAEARTYWDFVSLNYYVKIPKFQEKTKYCTYR